MLKKIIIGSEVVLLRAGRLDGEKIVVDKSRSRRFTKSILHTDQWTFSTIAAEIQNNCTAKSVGAHSILSTTRLMQYATRASQ